ncbi:hypothetical protein OG21DRAFT_1509361 [Imleria badia]|nr:hypothetical protein OG21DRAFT_1509361 [Imleria badia]
MHAKGLAAILLLPEATLSGVNANENFEGTPLVPMFDNPAHLAMFLKAMYVPS